MASDVIVIKTESVYGIPRGIRHVHVSVFGILTIKNKVLSFLGFHLLNKASVWSVMKQLIVVLYTCRSTS